MRFLVLMMSFVLLSAFSNATPFTTQKGGHCYTIDVPDYFVKTFNLNDVASVQYENTVKTAFLIVIEDDKERLNSAGIKFLDSKDFLLSFTDGYLLDYDNRAISDVVNFESNGNKLAQSELKWSEDEYDFFMIVTVVETKTHFYKILVWSLESNKNELYDDFQKISKSLKD